MVTLGVFCSTIKKKNIMKTICKLFLFLILTFLISCRENNKLEIIRDLHHFEPPHRNDKIINNFLTFSFSAQYFVFGYNKNKENFDSVLVKMVCNKINDVAHTWHHLEDGKTLVPVLQTVHSKWAHTGGWSVIQKQIIGFFE